MEIRIPNSVLHMHTFISANISRSNLGVLRIEGPGDGEEASLRRAIATNVHVMAIVSWHVDIDAEALTEPLHVPLADVKAVAKGAGKVDALIRRDGNTGPVVVEAGTYRSSFTPETVSYPDWRQVIPAPTDNRVRVDAHIGMDPTYVSAIMRHAARILPPKPKKATQATHAIRLDLRDCPDGLGPIVWRASNHHTQIDAMYVLMPVRL